jgi:outer membrane protein TolC
MKKPIFIALFLYAFGLFYGQNESQKLDINAFLSIVKQYHPVVKITQIQQQRAQAEALAARAGFDPQLSHQTAQKTFGQENYYQHQHSQINIPTWYGIELSAGIEKLDGERINNANSIGQSSYIGLNVPLLKNLLFDKRRAALAQAKINLKMAKSEQLLASNDLLTQAAQQYWQWALAQKKLSTVQANRQNSYQRWQMTKALIKLGERPAIDSTEAVLQLQNLELQAQEANLQLQKEMFELNAFLWQDNGRAYDISPEVLADVNWGNAHQSYLLPNLEQLIALGQNQHPELQIYEQKLAFLQVEKRLKFQDLLPKLDLKYHHLSKNYNPLASGGWLLDNNFQYGIKLEFPLFFSQARGDYQKAKLKIDETQWAQSQKSNSLKLKTQYYHSQLQGLEKILDQQASMLANYQKLLKAEEQRFENGESTLFLINSRENKVIESQIKGLELQNKYQQNYWALQGSLGLMGK